MKNKIFFQHAIIMGLILFLTSCSGGGGGGAGAGGGEGNSSSVPPDTASNLSFDAALKGSDGSNNGIVEFNFKLTKDSNKPKDYYYIHFTSASSGVVQTCHMNGINIISPDITINKFNHTLKGQLSGIVSDSTFFSEDSTPKNYSIMKKELHGDIQLIANISSFTLSAVDLTVANQKSEFDACFNAVHDFYVNFGEGVPPLEIEFDLIHHPKICMPALNDGLIHEGDQGGISALGEYETGSFPLVTVLFPTITRNIILDVQNMKMAMLQVQDDNKISLGGMGPNLFTLNDLPAAVAKKTLLNGTPIPSFAECIAGKPISTTENGLTSALGAFFTDTNV